MQCAAQVIPYNLEVVCVWLQGLGLYMLLVRICLVSLLLLFVTELNMGVTTSIGP